MQLKLLHTFELQSLKKSEFVLSSFLHSLDDEVWELRLHFQGRDNMERKFSLSEMNYLIS